MPPVRRQGNVLDIIHAEGVPIFNVQALWARLMVYQKAIAVGLLCRKNRQIPSLDGLPDKSRIAWAFSHGTQVSMTCIIAAESKSS